MIKKTSSGIVIVIVYISFIGIKYAVSRGEGEDDMCARARIKYAVSRGEGEGDMCARARIKYAVSRCVIVIVVAITPSQYPAYKPSSNRVGAHLL
jgi:hypothetical protein